MWASITYLLISAIIYKLYKVKISLYLSLLILFLEILSIINSSFLLYIMSIVLLFESITDCINNDVYTLISLFLIPLGLSQNRSFIDILISITIVPGLLFVLSKITNGMGTGDIILFFCLGFIFNYEELLWILLLSSLANFIYAKIYPKKYYAFVPFISIFSVFIYIISQ